MKNNPSVLVIDDEQIICDSCNRILTNENFKVETNTNPNEGYKQAIANDYDLLLLDLNMAGMDGMQLLSKLRKDKPELPVIIITGYPTKETKEASKNLGVNNYILKPFKPNEILDPVKRILNSIGLTVKKEEITEKKKEKPASFNPSEKNFRFLKNGWLQKGQENYLRVGGLLPVYITDPCSSIKTAGLNEKIYRGFPVAELSFGNEIKITIPSPVSGEIMEVNKELVQNPALFDDEEKNISWFADIMTEDAEADYNKTEIRNLVLLSKESKEKNNYLKRLTGLGYVVNYVNTVEEVLTSLSNIEGNSKVVVVDAQTFGEQGPQFVETINTRNKKAKVIVFNVTDSKLETLYREKKIFYYAVDPVSNREIGSIIYGVYCFSKDKEKAENTQTTFLPQTIRRIQITNRNSKKVVLLAFDNTIKFNKGVGFLLIQSLLDNSYPIEIVHSKNIDKAKDPSSAQFIAEEKLKNDKIIVLYKDNLNKIAGNINKSSEKFENSGGNDNVLIKIALQPENLDSEDISFDINTTRALAEFIESEMIS
jgi:CheY-like chemotaxis protein/uncharacterized protein YecE (DUF72 family)